MEEFGKNGNEDNYQLILSELKARDERDMNRSTSPLKPHENAYLLDTTNSDIEAVFEAACAYISNKE